jgi:hypothetical protein
VSSTRSFRSSHNSAREVDTSTECWFAPEDEQVVVDDKVCAFLLADYCKWGEHQDDFDPVGRQVFAETTRLFIRAKRNGPAWRKRVEDAQALPSRRKLMTQGLGYFASSGFPRDAAWIAGWGGGGRSPPLLELAENHADTAAPRALPPTGTS